MAALFGAVPRDSIRPAWLRRLEPARWTLFSRGRPIGIDRSLGRPPGAPGRALLGRSSGPAHGIPGARSRAVPDPGGCGDGRTSMEWRLAAALAQDDRCRKTGRHTLREAAVARPHSV